MASKFFEAINMFPYTQFMRIGGKQQLDHTCGGVVSLFIVLLITTVFFFRLSKALRKDTITFSSERSIDQDPPLTVLSTMQSN